MRLSSLLLMLFAFAINNTITAQNEPVAATNESEIIPSNEAKAKSKKEQTASFFELIGTGNQEEVEKLMRDSVDYYAHNKEGETALTIAIQNDDTDMVKILVKDAVINLKNQEGETPLTLAIRKGNPEIITLVCRRAKAALKNDRGEAPLFLAVENDNLFLVEELIKKGANVDRKSNGITPLAHATSKNNFRAVGYLIKEGATVNLPCDNGHTPLAVAIENGFDICAGILINKSADPMTDVNWRSKIDETLLNIAIVNSHSEVVKILLDAGAEVESQDYFENTALHIAAEVGNIEILQLLLMHGVPIDTRNLKGETPAMLANKAGKNPAVRFLIENGANGDLRDYTGYAVNDNFDASGITVKKRPEINSRLSKYQPTKKIEYEEAGEEQGVLINN